MKHTDSRKLEMTRKLDAIRAQILYTHINNDFYPALNKLRNFFIANPELLKIDINRDFFSKWLNDPMVERGRPVSSTKWTDQTRADLATDLQTIYCDTPVATKTEPASNREIPKHLWIPALVFTSACLVFLFVAFALKDLSSDQRRILNIIIALLSGFATSFLGGTAFIRFTGELGGVKVLFSGASGVAVFVLVLLHPPFKADQGPARTLLSVPKVSTCYDSGGDDRTQGGTQPPVVKNSGNTMSEGGWIIGPRNNKPTMINGLSSRGECPVTGRPCLVISFGGSYAEKSQIFQTMPTLEPGSTVRGHIWCQDHTGLKYISLFVEDHRNTFTSQWCYIDALIPNWRPMEHAVPRNAITPLERVGFEFGSVTSWSGECYLDAFGW